MQEASLPPGRGTLERQPVIVVHIGGLKEQQRNLSVRFGQARDGRLPRGPGDGLHGGESTRDAAESGVSGGRQRAREKELGVGGVDELLMKWGVKGAELKAESGPL